jgi:carboxynorspermidine decarboxylase
LTQKINTPAFIFDEKILRLDVGHLRNIADESSCRLLYSPKACSLDPVLNILSEYVDGFGCSSIYELKLVDQIAKIDQSIHLVSPLINEETIAPFGDRLGYVTMNLLFQWARLRDKISVFTQPGIRINPQLSFLNDPRHDPCRPDSKLGVPLNKLADIVNADHDLLEGLSGLHFHTNCDETDFAGLLATVRHIKDIIQRF